MITVVWAVQEGVLIVLNPSLTKAHKTSALKTMSQLIFTKVAKLDS